MKTTATLLSTMRTRREASSARRRLQREVAAYSTPSEVNDLLALVGDGDDAESIQMRNILVSTLQRTA